MKKKLIEVLKIQSESYNQFRMFAYIIRQLKKIGCDYYVYDGCIYATKGTANYFPCVVSHMDTVHEITENLTIIEVDGNLTGFNKYSMEQTGIGGDDKVGIFIALQCLETFDNIKAVFFRDEEVGCDGSYNADNDFFKDCGFVLQCDRRGNSDFITSASGVKLSGKDFQKDIKHILNSYGYRFANGMMTDVMALKENRIECSMANISCGYYNPHQENEYVNVYDVMQCLNMVQDIIKELQGESYICITKKEVRVKVYNYDYSGKWDSAFYDYGLSNKLQTKEQLCDCCCEYGKLEYVSEYNQELCSKCIDAFITPLKYSI